MRTFRMIACPTVLHTKRTDNYYESGKTVGECLREQGWDTEKVNARVFIDGELVPDAEWLSAKPREGQAVVVRSIPAMGGGGNTGKQIGSILMMVAIFAAALYAPAALATLSSMLGASGGVFGGILGASAYITAFTTIAGSLALNARIPTPLPRRALPQPIRELKEAA